MNSGRLAAANDATPRVIKGRYLLEAELGRGGMGRVYRARDQGLGRVVALKTLVRDDRKVLALFEREYETLAKLDHDRVIQVYDYGISDFGQPYYTMELLGGADIGALAPLPWQEVCNLLRDVCTSLSLLHAQRLVHRDVNPRNVRLGEHGRAKLLDFGALAAFGVAGELVGTPGYVAPEALRGKALDARTDLFALGAVMYFALTRQGAYRMLSWRDAESAFATPLRLPSQLGAGIPQALEELVLALLAVDPMGRPASAAEVIDRLGAIAGLPDESAAIGGESRVSSWVLAGREGEKGTLDHLLGQTVLGRGGVVSVVGEAGSGRSRLLSELRIEAQLRGLCVLALRASECAGEDELLRALLRATLAALPELARETLAPHHSILAPWLPEAAPAVDPSAADAHELHERRAQGSEAVARWLLEISGREPLLIIVDDAHVLHPSSAFALPLLAHLARRAQVRLAVSRRADEPCPPAVAQLSFMGPSLTLAPLSQAAVEQLLCSAFGDVPHRARLAQWLISEARGNPGQTLLLLRKLHAAGVVRNVGGTWTLPAEITDFELMVNPHQSFAERIAALSPFAQNLALTFAVHGRPLQRDVRDVLRGGASQREFDEALAQLVRAGLVRDSAEGTRVASNVAREELVARLGRGDERRVHHALATAIRAAAPQAVEAVEHNRMRQVTTTQLLDVISVGAHLMRGGEPEAGSKLLRLAAVELTIRGHGLSEAASDLEVAVEAHKALGMSWRTYVALLPPLVLAGTYVDFRLSYRYGSELMDNLERASGLRRARALAPYLGGRLALFSCMLHALFAFWCVPGRRVASSFREVLLGLIGIGSAVMSVATVLQDRERARHFGAQLSMLRHFPRRHAVREIHGFQEALLAHANGDYNAARDKARRALAYVRSEAAARLPAEARQQLEAGILTAIGQLDALRTDGSAQEGLAAFERLNTFTSRQTRTTNLVAYHGHRGERALYLRHLEELDRLAAETGAVWRHDVQVPRLLWSSHALCEDVISLKRSVEQLAPLAAEVPTVARLRDATHAAYLCERGLPREALARHGELFEQMREGELTLRDVQYLGIYARILRKAGEPARAREICEQALAALSPAQRDFRALTFCAELELPLCLFELGEEQRAVELLEALVASQTGHDNPMLHGLSHGAAAEVALARGDWPSYREHLAAMGGWLRGTENSRLYAQYQRLADRGRAREERPGPSEIHAARTSAERGRSAEELEARARDALSLCLRETAAAAGYLYALEDDALRLRASSADVLPPAWLIEQLARDLGACDDLPFETELLDTPPTAGPHSPDAIATLAEDSTPAAWPLRWPGAHAAAFVLTPAHAAPAARAVGVVILLEGTRPVRAPGATLLAEIADALGEQER